MQEMEEDKPWWQELLEVPDEILFGQMLKATLAAVDKEPLEGIWDVFRKNPLMQIIDMVLPGQPLTGDDVRFTDVRKAWGGTDVDEGWGNFFINLAGEILTDPTSYISFGASAPFKAVGTGGRGLTAVGKRTGDLVENARYQKWLIDSQRRGRAPRGVDAGAPVFPWEQAGPSPSGRLAELGVSRPLASGPAEKAIPFAEAIDRGARHMAVFRVPLTKRGWIVPTPKSMDLRLARGLERWGNFLNTSPLTKPLVTGFSRRGAPGIGATDGRTAADAAEIRGYVGDVLATGEELDESWRRPFMEMMNWMVRQEYGKQALEDTRVQQFITTISELPPSAIDDMGNISKVLQEGVGHLKALSRAQRSHKNSPMYRDLLRAAREGDAQAANYLHSKGLPLINPASGLIDDAVYDMHGLIKREGIELPDPRGAVSRDRQLYEAMPDAATPGMVERGGPGAAIPDPSKEVLEAGAAQFGKLVGDIKAEYGDEAMEAFVNLGVHGRTLMEKLGVREVGQGILNQLTENYFPRELTSQVKQVLHDQFMDRIPAASGASRAFIEKHFFQQGRTITDLTTWQANQLFYHLGNPTTGGIPIKEFQESMEAGARALEAKIFDKKFLRGLKKLAKTDESAEQAWEFFNTNPFTAWMRRIEQSGIAMSNREMFKHLLHADSPLIKSEHTLREATELSAKGELPLRPGRVRILVTGSGRQLGGALEKPGEIAALGAHNQNAARMHIARQASRDAAMRELADSKLTVDELISQIDDTLVDAIPLQLERVAPVAESLEESLTYGVVYHKELKRQLSELQNMALANKDARDALRQLVKRDELISDPEMIGALDELLDVLDLPPATGKVPKAEAKKLGREDLRVSESSVAGDSAHSARIEDVRGRYPDDAEMALAAAREQGAELADISTSGAARLEQIRNWKHALEPAMREEMDILLHRMRDLRRRRNEQEASLKELRRELREMRTNARAEISGARKEAYKAKLEVWGNARVRQREADLRKQLRRERIHEETARKFTGNDLDQEAALNKIHAERGVMPLDELRADHPEHYRKLVERTPDARVVEMDADVYQSVWGDRGVFENLRRPDAWGDKAFFKWLDQNTTWWKMWTLLPAVKGVPLFLNTRARDYMSNMALLWQQDASLGRAAQLARTGLGELGTLPLQRKLGMNRSTGFSHAGRQAAKVSRAVRQMAAGKMRPEMAGGAGFRGAGRARTVDPETWLETPGAGLGVTDDVDALSDTIEWTLTNGEKQSISVGGLVEKLQSRGLLDSSYVRDEIFQAQGEVLLMAAKAQGKGLAKARAALQGIMPPLLPGAKSKAGQNPLNKSGFETAQLLDNNSKITGVMVALENGHTLDEAIDLTRAWSYDPRKGLTNFERTKLRRVIPFYAWSKFAVRSQVQAYFTRPGTVTAWEKLRDSADKMIGMSPAERELAVPDFINSQFGVPYRRDENGNPEFAMFGGYFPVGDIARIVHSLDEMSKSGSAGTGVVRGAAHYVGENVHPYIKAPVETIFNYSTFNQRELELYPGQPTEMFGIEMSRKARHMLRVVRVGNEVDKLWPVSNKQATALLAARTPGTVDPSSMGRKFWESALNPMPRTRTADVDKAMTYKLAQAERQEGLLRGQLRKALEHPERRGSGKAPEVLRQLLAQEMARIKYIQDQQRERASRALMRGRAT